MQCSKRRKIWFRDIRSDNLERIFHEDYQIDLSYTKIADNLFKKIKNDKKLFYYVEKKNKIKFFSPKYDGEYYYLNDNMFACFNYGERFLYITDLSMNFIIKKINFNDIYKKNLEHIQFDNFCYFSSKGKEYYCLKYGVKNNNDYKEENKIIFGKIWLLENAVN